MREMLPGIVLCLAVATALPEGVQAGGSTQDAGLRERVLAGEREQERIAAATSLVSGRIRDLLKIMRANRAADAEAIGRWEQAVKELTALSQQNMVRAVTALRRARLSGQAKFPTFLRTASLEQRVILSRLLDLLRTIEKRVAFARVVDQLEQVIKDQTAAKDQTVEAARETLGKSPEQLSEAERQRMEDLEGEQEAVRESFDRLKEAMQNLQKSAEAQAAKADPEHMREADTVKRAVEKMEADRPDQDMRRAAADLAERKPVAAAQAQKQAGEKLRQLRDILRRDDSADLRRLDAAAAELDKLIQKQRQVKRDTGQLKPDSPRDQMQGAIKAQNPLTHATGELSKATESVSPKASDALRRAQGAQQQAEKRLADRRPDAAVGNQQKALDRMHEAKAAIDAKRKEVAERMAEPGPLERLKQVAADLDKLVKDQNRALKEAQRMADQAAKGQPANDKQLNRAAEQQRDLAERTQGLERDIQEQQAAPQDATRTLNAALKHQEAAAERLEQQHPEQAVPEQKKALSELQQAAANLRYQLKLAQEAQARADAMQRVLEDQDQAIEGLGEVAKGQRDLDELLEQQRALRKATGDLTQRMEPAPKRPALKPATARKAAGELAGKQRDLERQTVTLSNRMAELDRNVAKAMDGASSRQTQAAGELDKTQPKTAAPQQDKAIQQLDAARGHLSRKMKAIVALLKKLEAKRQELARAEGEDEPEESQPGEPGDGDVEIDELLKLASALVDIDQLKTRQDDTKKRADAEVERADGPGAKPNPGATRQLARKQEGHADEADELGRRMNDWDPEGKLGVEDVRMAVRAAGDEMHHATARLKKQELKPAVTNQVEALKNLDVAMTAAVQAFQQAAQTAQQQVQAQAQQVTSDPSEYDPNNRPPGQVGPEDLAHVKRWNVNLPPRVRDEIIAALGDPFPAGFESLLRRYYQDLSEEAWERLDLRREPR